MRVLVTAVPGAGHVNPVVGLARALQDAGHEVLFASGPDSRGIVERAGLRFVPAGLTTPVQREAYLERFPEARTMAPRELASFTFPRLFAGTGAPLFLADVLPVAKDLRPDLVVHESAEFSAAVVAGVLGVPHVTQGSGAIVPEPLVRTAGDLAAPLWTSVGLEPRPYGGTYDHLYLDVFPPLLQPEGGAYVTGAVPMRMVLFDDNPAAVNLRDAVPAGQGPLVHVTLGTVFHTNTRVLRAASEGVVAAGARALVTVGPSGDVGALDGLGPAAAVVPYVRHTEAFPLCAAVVSHGGGGTFIAALSHGLPLLCLPQAADQHANAALCERAGVGIVLRGPEVTPERVAAAVRRLLDEPSFAVAARTVAAEIAAMPHPSTIVPRLEEIAARGVDRREV